MSDDILEEISAAEKNKRYSAAYYRLNRDRILQKVKNASLEKKDKISKMKASYYQRNKGLIKEKNRADYQKRKLLDKSMAEII